MFERLLALARPILFPSGGLRLAALLVMTALTVTMVVYRASPVLMAVAPNPPWDKLAHAIVFAGYGTLAWVATGARTIPLPMFVVLCIACLDEGFQYYTPGRVGDLRDIVADLTGAALAMAVLHALRGRAAAGRPGRQPARRPA